MKLNARSAIVTTAIVGLVLGGAGVGLIAASAPTDPTPAPVAVTAPATTGEDSVPTPEPSSNWTPEPTATPTPSASPAAEPIGSGLDDDHPWRGGPYTTEPQVPKTPAPAPSPTINAPLNCAPWTEPGWLGADGQPTSCIWAMPTAGGTIVLKACEQEDSENCFWDAQQRGNGQGRSFINIRGHVFFEEAGQ